MKQKWQFKNEISPLILGIIEVDGVTVVKKNDLLWQEIEGTTRNLREKYRLDNISQIEMIKKVRELYKAVGMDPSRYRPASEALLRRILKGQSLYQINSVVDTNNLCSLEELLPMGVYDVDKIVGDNLTFRMGKRGERFQGIGRDVIEAEGKVVMANQAKICGSPTSDAIGTMITSDTKNVLMVIYFPKEMVESEIGRVIDRAAERLISYNEGRLVLKTVLY